MSPKKLLQLAAKVSRLKRRYVCTDIEQSPASRLQKDDRNYFLGAVGVRSDDVVVFAANGAPKFPEPKHHAEYRLSRKLTANSSVYVARTLADGLWANARPCDSCLVRLINIGVSKIYYTISYEEYGVMEL